MTDLETRVQQHYMQNGSGEQEVFISASSAYMIGKLVIEIIKAIRACRKEDQVQVLAHEAEIDPSSISNRQLNRMIRRQMGWREYRKNGERMRKSILAAGLETQPGEIQNCVFYDEG